MSKKQNNKVANAKYMEKVNKELNYMMLTAEVNTLIQIYTDFNELMPKFMRPLYDDLLEKHLEAFNLELTYCFPDHPFEITFKTLATMPIYPIEQKLFNRMTRAYDAGIAGGYDAEFKAITTCGRLRELSELTVAKDSNVFKALQDLKLLTQVIISDSELAAAGEMTHDEYAKKHADVFRPTFIGIFMGILSLDTEYVTEQLALEADTVEEETVVEDLGNPEGILEPKLKEVVTH